MEVAILGTERANLHCVIPEPTDGGGVGYYIDLLPKENGVFFLKLTRVTGVPIAKLNCYLTYLFAKVEISLSPNQGRMSTQDSNKILKNS